MSQQPPLQGITVIEMGSTLAAPFAATILGEMGADVIKVERPDGGDMARGLLGKASQGHSPFFATFNRNKKSITINFDDADQLARLRRLILEKADVALQNLRPGVVEELGIGGDALLAEKPSLVYCNLGAFGDVGPLNRLPGYDGLLQAFSGMCYVTGPEDGEACRVGVPVNDMGTGMWAVIGILTKLLTRKETGKGGIVDVALFETAMTWMSMHVSSTLATGKMPGRYGIRGVPGTAPNRSYAASDGPMIITANTPPQFRNLSATLGHPEWANDERFTTPVLRSQNDAELSRLIGSVIQTNTREYWMDRLNEASVPNAPVHTPLEAINHPQLAASGLLQGAADGASPQIVLPLKFDHQRLPYRTGAPMLGEHNDLLK